MDRHTIENVTHVVLPNMNSAGFMSMPGWMQGRVMHSCADLGPLNRNYWDDSGALRIPASQWFHVRRAYLSYVLVPLEAARIYGKNWPHQVLPPYIRKTFSLQAPSGRPPLYHRRRASRKLPWSTGTLKRRWSLTLSHLASSCMYSLGSTYGNSSVRWILTGSLSRARGDSDGP